MFEIYRYASHHLCLDRDDEAVTACEISNLESRDNMSLE